MRPANRSLRYPARVRSLFVEPLEDRLVLSSITPASISPSTLPDQQEEIVSIVPIDAQRDATESNGTSNDATPGDDYIEPTTPGSDTAAVAANHSRIIPVGTLMPRRFSPTKSFLMSALICAPGTVATGNESFGVNFSSLCG